MQAQSKTVVNNTGIKSTDIDISVRQGSFDAHGGIIGGYIDVHNISAKGKHLFLKSLIFISLIYDPAMPYDQAIVHLCITATDC